MIKCCNFQVLHTIVIITTTTITLQNIITTIIIPITAIINIITIDMIIITTRSYAALRAADLDWIVGPEYSSGGYILMCSQRLASCLRHSARTGPHLLCHPSAISGHPSSIIRHPSSVVRHPSSIICYPSSVIHCPPSVVRHPSWK